MKTIQEITKMYAHDFRSEFYDEDTMVEILTSFLREISLAEQEKRLATVDNHNKYEYSRLEFLEWLGESKVINIKVIKDVLLRSKK